MGKDVPGRRGRARAAVPAVPVPEVADSDLSEEDVAFVRQHRASAFLKSTTTLVEDAPPSKRRAKAAVKEEDGEEAYERAPRVAADWQADATPAEETDTLPSRNMDGDWEYKKAPREPGAAAAPNDKASKRKREASAAGAEAAERPAAASALRAAAAAELLQLQEQELSTAEKKERIAAAAAALMEAPERNIGELKVLHKLAADKDAAVARLASLSAMLVFKDLAPGYRIRLPTEKELEMAVSKDVQVIRDYETAFLKAYQNFLKLLLAAVSGAGESKGTTKGGLDERTAIRCMCGLLQALPHFNYRTDLLRALVPFLAADDAAMAGVVKDAVAAVLQNDARGEAALEAVQLLAELVKTRGCKAPTHTLDVLQALRFSEDLAARLTDERDAGKPLSQKQRNRKWIEERRRMRDEAKSATRRGDDKAAPSGDAGGAEGLDERTLREFDAVPDAADIIKLQTRTLEAVCEIHFRVLKGAVVPTGPVGRPLLGPTLTGLARVAHLIDYEVVADILEVLRQLLAEGQLPCDLQAQCLLTACSLLGGQGAALAVDTRDFHRHLYGLAAASPSVATTHAWSDASAATLVGEKGAVASRLWVQALSAMLLARAHRQVDTERIAAFAKRLAEVSLHAETGESVGSLAVMRELLCRHARLRRLLENEPGAPGSFMPEAAEPEGACALSSCLWELALLQSHSHPGVAALAAHVAAMPVEDAALPAFYGAATPEELVGMYTTTMGGFRPAVPPPKAVSHGRQPLCNIKSRAKLVALEAAAEAPGGKLRCFFREAREFRRNERLRDVSTRLQTHLRAGLARARDKSQAKLKKKIRRGV